MHNHGPFIVLALLFLLFGLVSRLADRSYFTAPMVFMFVGAFIAYINADLVTLHISSVEVKFIAEVTLIIILFTDASLIRFRRLKQVLVGIPGRLLGIGLPLTMILGTLSAGLLFPEFDIWLALLVALILSPTDAALGQAVIKNAKVPETIRRAIGVESGLNDGIALPPILMARAALSISASHDSNSGHWLSFMAMQLILGPLVGAMIGKLGGALVDWAANRDWMNNTFQQLSGVSLAILGYSCAELIGGNGFIAAFFAGLMFGSKLELLRQKSAAYGEAHSELLSLGVFFILGVSAVPFFYPFWDIKALIYALLSLTIIRMLPVFISLIGSDLDTYSKLFIGWFGPRGIASVLYLLIVITDIGVAGFEYPLSIIVLTICISVFAHGATATLLSNVFKKTVE